MTKSSKKMGTYICFKEALGILIIYEYSISRRCFSISTTKKAI